MFCSVAISQTDSIDFNSTKTDSIEQDIFTPKIKLDPEQKRSKKPPRNFYFGYKTRKGYTRTKKGATQTIELFNYLKVYQDPNLYVPDFFWYDMNGKQIKRSGDLSKVDKRYIGILHGPYLKTSNKDTIEVGNYYLGNKHGRWEIYQGRNQLKDKKRYYKGWLAESKISYYDVQRSKVKEVIPIEFGKREGNYYQFYDNGLIAMEGQYKNGVKVGKWIEYYKTKRKRKSEIQYTNDPYDKNFKPYKLHEWDEKGNLIYDWEKAKSKPKPK